MVMEVKLHYFRDRGSTTEDGNGSKKFFLPFLNEFGNSKLFCYTWIFTATTSQKAWNCQIHSEMKEKIFTATAMVLPRPQNFTSINVVLTRLYQQMIWWYDPQVIFCYSILIALKTISSKVQFSFLVSSSVLNCTTTKYLLLSWKTL